ncbi:MAG: hypothetical protein ACXWR0_11915 [Bdellovibrio sp.]
MHYTVILSFFTCVSQFALAGECIFSSKPIIISQSEHELHQFWQIDDNAVFMSNEIPSSAPFIDFISSVKNKIADTSPKALLSKQYNDFISSGVPTLIAEAPNMLLAMNKTAGKFHSINCLEALLLSQQVDRGLSWDNPMEFSAFILKNATDAKLKIYYSTNDRPGGKINSQIIDLIQTDVSNGWVLLNHLHNHTFNTPVSNAITLVGGPSPGLTDVQLYRDLYSSLGLNSASVTNGFDTLYIDHTEFNIFHTR